MDRGPLVGRAPRRLRLGPRGARHEEPGGREAAAALTLAEEGWRPEAGELLLVFTCDEETGAEHGARWLCEQHPDRVACDMVVNEGAGECSSATAGGSTACARARRASSASPWPPRPRGSRVDAADRRQRAGEAGAGAGGARRRAARVELTPEPEALLSAMGLDPSDLEGAVRARAARPAPGRDVRADARGDDDAHDGLGVAEDQRDPLARAAARGLPGAAGDGRGARARAHPRGARRRRLDIDFDEQVVGNRSPLETPLMGHIRALRRARGSGRGRGADGALGFTDSRWFREAFPDCIAYGFCPRRDDGQVRGGAPHPRRRRAHARRATSGSRRVLRRLARRCCG